MQQKKSINFGFRGWMLILWVATAMFSYIIIGNYPLNILAEFYGGAQTLSLVYTGASVVGIIIQLIVSRGAGKVKSWKWLGAIFGIVSIVCLVVMMLITPGLPWIIVYGIGTCISAMYGTWALSVLVGVWFPRRKGTVMGIITFAFPIGNGLIGFFAEGFFAKFGMLMETQMGEFMGTTVPNLIASGVGPAAAEGMATGMAMNMFVQQTSSTAFIPYLIPIVVGLLIGLFLIKDFPEQVGAYRDNDKTMTPEIANAMMKAEEENRKTTVWTTGRTFATPDFWFITIPMGLLLMFAVGAMTQTQAMLAPFEEQLSWIGGYSGVMMVIAAFGIIGSFIFGVVDTKFGTKRALVISMGFMVISGILGFICTAITLFVGLIFLAMFMGASSNYTVSAAVQYWRIEDFPSVFSVVNPVANLINAFGPTIVAALIATALGTAGVFVAIGVAGIIGGILALLFKPSRVKERDDKLRAAAGKPLDDVLVGRK